MSVGFSACKTFLSLAGIGPMLLTPSSKLESDVLKLESDILGPVEAAAAV